jgi:phosphoglycerol transferase MdoB-like AlkP superfamily enzyme
MPLSRPLHLLRSALLRAWLFVVISVVALGLIRLGQSWYLWPAGLSLAPLDGLKLVLQGLRFDLKVSAVLGILLCPVLVSVSVRSRGWWVAGMGFILVMLSLANVHYLAFYKTPIDALAFGLFEDDTTAVLQTIWHDFPVLRTLLIGMGLSLLALTAYRRWESRCDHLLAQHGAAVQLVAAALLLLSLALAAKGTLRSIALQRQHLSVTASPFLNDLVPNGAIALKYAWDSRRLAQDLKNPLVGLQKMGYASPLQAAQVLGLPHADDMQLKAAMVQHPPVAAGTPQKNLLFFLMESWSAEPLLYQSAEFDVLGRLAAPLAQACHFSNFDSAQGGTHPTLEAILFSTPITPLTLGAVGRKPLPWALPRIMQQAGYRTLFVTSGRAGWRELDRVLLAQGFDEVVDAGTLQALYPQAPLGVWGTWDHYVFEYLRQRMHHPNPAQPLFVFVLTSTNHPPYDLPPDYQRVPRNMALWQGETHSELLQANLDSYHYAADLLGGFVQALRTSPWKNNTVVAATGDHNVRTFGLYAQPERRHLMRQVPFVIWDEGLDCPKHLTRLSASHRDMVQTLLPLVGASGPYLNTGRNLLSTGSPDDPLQAPRALSYTGEARTGKGVWPLGQPGSFVCSPGPANTAAPCQLLPEDDAQERARYGLLDWWIRSSMP